MFNQQLQELAELMNTEQQLEEVYDDIERDTANIPGFLCLQGPQGGSVRSDGGQERSDFDVYQCGDEPVQGLVSGQQRAAL